MKTKLKIIAVLVSLAVFLLIIAIFLILPGFYKGPKIPPRIMLEINCEKIKNRLLRYYEELEEKAPESPSSDFVAYLTGLEKDSQFSREPPVAPYKSERDLGFYLLLPVNLDESGRPLLIGYTTSITTKTGLRYCGTFFLREKEIVAVTIEDWVLRNIIGSEDFEKRKPDFYIWKKRSKYLRDQSDKGK